MYGAILSLLHPQQPEQKRLKPTQVLWRRYESFHTVMEVAQEHHDCYMQVYLHFPGGSILAQLAACILP